MHVMVCRFDVASLPRCALMLAAVLLASAVVGCGGGAKPVDELELAAAEGRFIVPFTRPSTLVTDDLVIELTANFYDELGMPALLDGLQKSERKSRPDGGTDYLYRNQSPGAHMTFLLRQAELLVLRSARITVLGGARELALDLDANGRVSVVDVDGRRDGSRFRVSGGVASLTTP